MEKRERWGGREESRRKKRGGEQEQQESNKVKGKPNVDFKLE